MTNYLVNITGMFCVVRAKSYEAAQAQAQALAGRASRITDIRVATDTEYEFFKNIGGVMDAGLLLKA